MSKTSKNSKPKKLKGADGFENYYSNIFGDRWSFLKKALLEPVNYFKLEFLNAPYYLDKASYFAATSLPKLESGLCLDMCAAPGGKALVLMTKVLSSKALLQANELSAKRRGRLKKVLNECLSYDTLNRVTVSGYDGSLMCKKKRNAYDRILVDAPCSSERHVLSGNKYLDQWTESRIKNLSQRQWALLSSSFLLLKENGFLLYSTCAISTQENDDVVEKLLKKYPEAKIVKIQVFEKAEPTKYGLIFLPDKSGYGPLYFSLIQKVKTL